MSKFWVEDISYLFHSFYLVPTRSMGLEEQMNCITRIVLLIFLIMLFANISYDVLFLAVSVLLIIGAYYLIKAMPSKKENFIEYYGKVDTVLEPVPPTAWNQGTNEFEFSPLTGSPTAPCRTTPLPVYPAMTFNVLEDNPQIMDPQTSLPYMNQNIPIEASYGQNQSYAGPPNPRTLVQPIIPNPIFDFGSWQPNDFIVPSGINDQKRVEFWQNGYVVSSQETPPVPPIREMYAKYDYEPEKPEFGQPYPSSQKGPLSARQEAHNRVRQEFRGYQDHRVPHFQEQQRRPPPPPPPPRYPQHQHPQHPQHPQRTIREDYYSPDEQQYNNYAVRSNYYNQTLYNQTKPDPYVDRQCGYDPDNLRYELPVNYRADACQKTPSMTEYNKNLFSIPLQPGVYTQSQVNQPYASMSNLGISMNQPFLPTTSSFDDKTQVFKYVEHDPATVKPVPVEPYNSQNFGAPLRNEIYDPRLTGYGTSYRSYIEPLTGQPRFYYDDIDQQTQPNYITRNNLDIYGGLPTIGAANQKVLEGDALRTYTNQNYTDNQIQYRTELQQRLMHKNSNREWQQRIAPITTTARMLSGGGTMSGYFK
uniref:Minor capsid protein P9 transmembrane helices domain-containing protein n=1 Tax=viral metagenome TaxID=1070528 RepID=A0A6C0K731_9ZZZZ